MESSALSDFQGRPFWGAQEEKLRSQCRNVGFSRGGSVPRAVLHREGGEAVTTLCSLYAWESQPMMALGCCFLGDIGTGPGPGLQKEAGACVRRLEGGVSGMGEC